MRLLPQSRNGRCRGTVDVAPAHIHVRKAGAWARIELPTSERGARISAILRMNTADVVRAVRIMEANVEALNNAWETYHGDENTE